MLPPVSHRVLTVVFATALLLTAAAPAFATSPAPDPGAGPIAPTEVEWLTDRLAEVTFANPRVHPPVDPTKVRILVPPGWRTADEAYPSVLLLHGAGDRYDGWTEKHDGWPTTLEEFTADKDVVVVMPDGGTGESPGWYSDWFNDGDFGAPQWETWHIAQLIPWVKDTFPVRRDRGGWVVAGLSMGGFGAMSYLARHPDLFAGGFSFSGALNTRPEGEFIVPDGVWGSEVDQEVRYRGHNPSDLVDNLHDAEVIWFRTGQGVAGGPAPKDNDPAGMGIESGAWETNEAFDRALDREGIEHHYEAYPQGAHNWWHWHDGFQNHAWPVMADLFAREDVPDVPAAFHYRTIESTFDTHGWRVSIARDVVEFATLDVDGLSLTLTGSGTAIVTTPPRFEPGAVHRIGLTGTPTTEVGSPTVTADPAGRLRFEVTLGPSHEYQQFTAPQRAAAAAGDYWQTATVTISPIESDVTAPAPDAQPGGEPGAVPAPASSGLGETALPATGAGTALIGVSFLLLTGIVRRRARRTPQG